MINISHKIKDDTYNKVDRHSDSSLHGNISTEAWVEIRRKIGDSVETNVFDVLENTTRVNLLYWFGGISGHEKHQQ